METSAASDSELLAAWVAHRCESAFHALVARYATLVHMAAKRTCGDDSLAADASQLVFILLAQKAKSLTTHPTLAGWLHVAAVLKTRDLLDKARRESRKRQHLSAAMETNPSNPSGDVWQEMQPVLDDALGALSAKDREALLLRFYRSLSVREIAATLGIATDAAQKRIDRATERLRGKLARRGCQAGRSLSAAMLAGFTADAQAVVLPVSVIATKAIAEGAVTSFSLTALLATTAALMKSTSMIPPVVALILAGAWTRTKYHSLSATEARNEELRRDIAIVRSTDPHPSVASKFLVNGGAVDWKLLAGQLPKSYGVGKSRAIRLFEARWDSLEPGEMAAELERIDTLDLPADDRKALERFLMDSLMRKAPGLGLSWVVGYCKDGEVSADYGTYFQNWASKDPAKATEWLDREIATGKFDSLSLDGKNDARSEFELKLIRLLIKSDPAAVGRRLGVMPAEQRIAAMQDSWLDKLFTQDPSAYVKLIREHLPPKDRLATFSLQSARVLSKGDYPEATAYLNLIQATPEERIACAGNAAERKFESMKTKQPITREDLDVLRDWVGSQAPAAVDEITGNVLAEIAATTFPGKPADYDSKTGFAEAAALAAHYHETSGNDAVITNFLKCFAVVQNKEQARVLAGRLFDETLRAQTLKKIH